MEDSAMTQVDVKNKRQGKPLTIKIVVLSIIMIVIIALVVLGYLISFYSRQPKVTSKEGSVSYLDIGQTQKPCDNDLKDSSYRADCVEYIQEKTDNIAHVVNDALE